ncbi:molybdopterin-synthase adenylyltransferase MoeB [Chryseobacterium shandongense]|uniref:Molybdopterin-synthase adenylyltransferase n=1 Tax=Chryseobacterium shandongense TaxID=1493872 RepID=A0AAD0YCJ0_9FLAO|nr:HesA/MoeB/ThiF family protein [Chryseobacterium shandongense]AZA88826.1 molybdopterin-synthase adenylyltransferase MoeB [Chryseobacterium shandongense]AZA97370.1 molybdopterin-synthase adenylyltransferase MoeB [Chryseobacterium shandongense]
MLNKERYDRQIKLQGFGIEAQHKLASAKILVIGAGGLGCPVLQYLTAAGVGNIGIVDDDRVSLSNLHRQILYNSDDVGKLKTKAAFERLNAMNPEVKFSMISERINSQNAVTIVSEYDVVLDCTDNFATRYLLDDVCRILEKTLIFGAIYQYEGQVAVFNVRNKEGFTTHYRNLFPEPPNPGEVPDCNEAGVLGVLPGVVGTLQATEAIKLIAGIGEALINKLMTIDILTYQSAVFEIPSLNLTDESIPYSIEEFEKMNYQLHCGIEFTGIKNISPSEFKETAKLPDTVVIDVREMEEQPKLDVSYVPIPLSQLKENVSQIQSQNIILVCQSGKRSLSGAKILQEILSSEYSISHLEGGINHLIKETHE